MCCSWQTRKGGDTLAIWSTVPDTQQRAVGLMSAPLSFSLALVQTVLAILSFLPLEMGVFVSSQIEVWYLIAVFATYFIGAHCEDNTRVIIRRNLHLTSE